MDLELEGARAVVTGGSKGIGHAVVRALVREGASVCSISRSETWPSSPTPYSASDRTGSVVQIAADLNGSGGTTEAFERSIDVLGGVDIVVNCTGSSPAVDPIEGDDSAFLEAMSFKYMSYVRMTRLGAKHMLGQGTGGRIVNIVGAAGIQPIAVHLPGGAANAAILLFSKGFARVVAPHGIVVNCINPGPVLTPRLERLYEAIAESESITADEAREHTLRDVPRGKAAAVEEIADLALFLASPRSNNVIGAHINTDGGWIGSL
jgi:NAD(P)-dependent dehydrogenase (short-subunit alcohol dehydrogenase family)